MDRRTALKGIAGIIAAASAPAIIPIKSIMPVKQIITPFYPGGLIRIPIQVGSHAAYFKDEYELRFPSFSFVEMKQSDFQRGISCQWINGEIKINDRSGNPVNFTMGNL